MGAARIAARRAAGAMVRANGVEMRLEIPAPPVAGDNGEQVGLSAPQFQTLMVAPVAVRDVTDGVELLIAADVLENVLRVSGFGAVRAVMATAYAALVGDVRYRLAGTECVHSAGDA